MEDFESSMSPEPTIEAIRALADVSFNATVISLGAAPGYPSGYVTAYQGVTASVTELRSGQGLQVGDQIDLAVPVVGSSSHAAAGPGGVPALDPAVFSSGAPFAAWAKWVGDRWTAILVDIQPAPRLYAGKGGAGLATDRNYGRARSSTARAMDEPSPYDTGYFKDADKLREMVKDQIAADTLLVSRKSDAIAVVNSFAGRTSPSPWTSLDRGQVATRLSTLINNPRLLHQGNLNLCGPAAFLVMWSNRDPVSFANWATAVFDNGQANIGSMSVAPHSDLLASDYSQMRKRMGNDITEQADWMVMGAIRNSTEVWWQSDWKGDPDQELAGLTRPSEVADWLRATGIYSTVRDECNLMTSRGLPHALDLMPGGGIDVAFFLNINALIHNRATGGPTPPPDTRFLLNQFPNHFAVLVNEVLFMEQSQTVTFNLWTWGVPTYYAFEVPLADFIGNYYGAISCFLRR